MVEPVALIRPESNTELVELLRAAIEQAERGDFTRAILIKLRADHSFAVHCVGVGSDLAAAGALALSGANMRIVASTLSRSIRSCRAFA